jgi:DNA-binding response OmpR family regulator
MSRTSEPALNFAGRRILVIEDQYLLADDIRRVLQDLGAHVVGPAPNLARGLQLIDAERIDAAVLDINLGGKDVFPLAEELKSRNVPFVFATGYEHWVLPPHFRGELRLEKPIEVSELVEALHRVLTDRAAGP